MLSITPHGQISSFPLDSNQQQADYKSDALPLRQRSMLGAEGIEPTLAVYKTAALPLDEAPLKTDIFFKREQQVARRPGDVGSATTGVERRHRTCGLPVNGRTLCQLSYEPIYFFCRALKLPIWFSVSGPSDCLHDPCVFTDSNRFDSVTGYCFTIVLCCEGHSLCRTLFDSMVISHVQRYCCKCPCIVFRPVDWIRTNNNFVPNDLICC